MTTSKSPAPPALADDAGARTRGPNWPGFRSLSRAMFRGFVRDRAALFFTILFPVLFLLLFGSLYKSSTTPRIHGTAAEAGAMRTATTAARMVATKLSASRACIMDRSKAMVGSAV